MVYVYAAIVIFYYFFSISQPDGVPSNGPADDFGSTERDIQSNCKTLNPLTRANQDSCKFSYICGMTIDDHPDKTRKTVALCGP